MILNFRNRLIKNYLSKVFYIIEQGSKQLSLLPNYVGLGINMIDQLDTYYSMVYNKAISAVANTTKQLNIQKDMHMIYKHDLYNNKEN